MNIKFLAIVIFLSITAFLPGCTQTTANLAAPPPDPSTGNPSTPAALPNETTSPLTEGEYCYNASNDNLDATVRLTVNTNNQVAGQANIVYHNASESYYSSATQSLGGTVQGDKLHLKLITEIEGSVLEENEIWNISLNGIEIKGVTYNLVNCATIIN